MLRLILLFLLIAAAGLGAGWLIDHSGHITIAIAQREYETNLAYGLFAITLLVAILIGCVALLNAVLRAPGRMREKRANQRRDRGLLALSRGMVAVAAGDAKTATRLAKDAEHLLPDPALTLLLSAQAAQLSGDEPAAQSRFTAMLAHPDTEFLGLRGLFAQAMRRGDKMVALAHLQRADNLRPGTPWVVNALFDLHAKEHRWNEAQDAVSAIERAKLIDSGVARRRRAVLIAAEAEEIALRDPARALSLAEEALKLSPGLTPAAVLAARLTGADGRAWKAQAIVETAWAQAPHPDLAQVYAGLKSDETPRAKAERMLGLAERNKDNIESQILSAQQWLSLKDYAQARSALGALPQTVPSARIAALMAEISQGQGHPHETRFWLERAVRAPREPQWSCDSCHSPAPRWVPVCATCGAFDALTWRVRSETLRGEAVPLPPPAPPLANAGEARSSAPAPGEATRAPAATTPATEGEVLLMPRAPDDPGPVDDDGEEPRSTVTRW